MTPTISRRQFREAITAGIERQRQRTSAPPWTAAELKALRRVADTATVVNVGVFSGDGGEPGCPLTQACLYTEGSGNRMEFTSGFDSYIDRLFPAEAGRFWLVNIRD